MKIYLRMSLLLLVFYFLSVLPVSSREPYQFRRQGFIYDEKGQKVNLAFMELTIYMKRSKNDTEEKDQKFQEKTYQTVSNDEGLYFFNVFLDIDPQSIIATKMTWLNYKKMFPEKAGKYSPGYNPFWEYTKDYLDGPNAVSSISLFMKRDISLLSKENPIDKRIARKAGMKFAPILIFAEDKKYLPSNLERFQFFYSRESYKVKKNDRKGFPPHDGKYLRLKNEKEVKKLKKPGKPYLYYHIRPKESYYGGQQTGRLEDFFPKNYWYGKSSDGYIISYWFWYDYSEGPSWLGNSAQGSFQGFAVSTDKNLNPERILTIGHGQILVDTEWKNIDQVDNHPILYVATGAWSDGSNVTIANVPVKSKGKQSAKEIKVKVESGFVNFLGFPKDIFPKLNPEKYKAIVPGKKLNSAIGLSPVEIAKIKIGKNGELEINLNEKNTVEWLKLVRWPEPGWNADESFYQEFEGRIGRHPYYNFKWLLPHFYGKSPANVPFEKSNANIFIREYPHKDRFFFFKEGKHYGPYWFRP